MNTSDYIEALVAYGIERELIDARERIYTRNALLALLQLTDFSPMGEREPLALHLLLEKLCDDAVARGLIADTVTERDLLDTALMGALTQRPGTVEARFFDAYVQSPEAATDWFYRFCQDVNYIRRDRIAKDVQWKTPTPYGALDITINLSKPEKDPRDIAAAKSAPPSSYPKCLLCAENEGYAGHANHPARQNHRLISVKIAGEPWAMQYSPYVYYPEHCILLNTKHVPMVIDRSAFAKLLSFIEQFPHYFVGSNADLPIVGGSILSHEHFQGGHYSFPMERAQVVRRFTSPRFGGSIGVVNWPMSVLRLAHAEIEPLVDYADRILAAWRAYSNPSQFIFAETDGEPHNTITPIARKRDGLFELDLVLRNNITTEEHPLGVFHPHAELHHIKKENIGLIEVMGLAVLPSRLKAELASLETAILNGKSIRDDPQLEKHADWAQELLTRHPELDAQNAAHILQDEVGQVFRQVLEHAGVYRQSTESQAAFDRFIETVL